MRWRRRNELARQRYRDKRATERFLYRRVPNKQPIPFRLHDAPTLARFCADRGSTFLALPRLLQQMRGDHNDKNLQLLLQRSNICTTLLGLRASNNQVNYWNCPLVWDTGASFGLSPFRGDFIDYMPCEIPVNDIKSTNIVVGLGTTLHKFSVEGQPL